jgi:hypothetical protein
MTARYFLIRKQNLAIKGMPCTKQFVIHRRSHDLRDSIFVYGLYANYEKAYCSACTDAVAFPRKMFFFDTGAFLGGHVRAVFTLITFIFIVCVAFTLTSFKEIPLDLLEQQEQVCGDLQKGEDQPTVNALMTGTDRRTFPD